MIPDDRFYVHDMDDANTIDVIRTAVNDCLIGIVDNLDGGIIAYAIGEKYAALIVDCLRDAHDDTEVER